MLECNPSPIPRNLHLQPLRTCPDTHSDEIGVCRGGTTSSASIAEGELHADIWVGCGVEACADEGGLWMSVS